MRDIACAVVVYKLAWMIDPFAQSLLEQYKLPSVVGTIAKRLLWAFYWFWQGIIFTGWWCMAHEAGHGTLFNNNWLNHLIGYLLHTVCLPFVISPRFP